MALSIFQRTVTDNRGNIIPGASVAVRDMDGGDLVPIFEDRAGVTQMPNPFVTDSEGMARFYTEPGEYQVTATSDLGSVTWVHVAIDGTLRTDLATTGAGKGAEMVAYKRVEAGAQDQTVNDLLDQQHPSVMSLIPASEHAAIYAKTSTFDAAPAFQALIDTGKPFTAPAGAKFRLNSRLTWKSGAKLLCYGNEYLINSADNHRTTLEFDSTLTTSGIYFEAAANKAVKDWRIQGVVIQGIGANRYTTFAGLRVGNGAGFGVMQFNLEDVTITNCAVGIDLDDAMFSGRFERVLVSYCVRGVRKTSTDFLTSWTGDINFFHVFAPWNVVNATYMKVSSFFDRCGLQADAAVQGPADEMPILFRGDNVQSWNFGLFGVENSNAIIFRLENYSTVSASVSYWQPITDVWSKSSTRISNISEARQALFSLSSSWLQVTNMRSLFSAGSGYPAVGASNFSFFEGDASARLTFENSILDMRPYIVCDSGLENRLTGARLNNGAITFGNARNWRQDFNYVNGYVVAGSDTTPDYHFFQRNRTFVQGEEAFRVTGATSASASLRLFAVNGAGGNSANAACRVAADSVTSRSINAGGTVNVSGADYAEYERNNGLNIDKGQIVGFKADGTLTLTFAEAVRFGVKSTDPGYVGGDNWSTANEPAEDAPKEEWATYKAQMEADRASVDRIAYCGKVPANVWDAKPGQYIIAAEGANGEIVGAAVSEPTFEQYRIAIGRVNRVMDDGRAEVAVIVH